MSFDPLKLLSEIDLELIDEITESAGKFTFKRCTNDNIFLVQIIIMYCSDCYAVSSKREKYVMGPTFSCVKLAENWEKQRTAANVFWSKK